MLNHHEHRTEKAILAEDTEIAGRSGNLLQGRTLMLEPMNSDTEIGQGEDAIQHELPIADAKTTSPQLLSAMLQYI